MRTLKHKNADLKSYYTLFLETGLIITLILFLVATKIEIKPQPKQLNIVSTQESVMMEEIVNTKQELKPPSVPRPVVPVEVPNDEIISDEVLNIDAELRLDEMLDVPPPPAFNNESKEEEREEEKFFIVVEQMPQLIGGLESLQSHIEYPQLAQRANIQGLVLVQFIINEKGEVVDPVVTRGIGGGCDEEALRVVKNYAKFIPGRQRGEPVRVQFSIPIRFKLVGRSI